MAKPVWSDTEWAEIYARRRLRRLFEGLHDVYFVLPSGEERRYEYVTVNWLGDTLSQTWKRLLFRQFPTIAAANEGDEAEVERMEALLDLPGLALPSALMVSWAGRAVWKGYYSRLSRAPVFELWGKHDGEAVTFDYLPADPSQPVAVNFWYAVEKPGAGQPRTYWIRERHELMVNTETGDVGGVRMTNTAYANEGSRPVGEPVSLVEAWPAGEPPAEEETIPGMTALPCVVVQNVDRNGDRRGDTDYTPSLISLQKNVNKLAASRQYVIDTCEEPNLTIPQEYLDEDGEVDWRRVKLRVRYPGEDGESVDISGWTGNLANSASQWDFYRQEFQALTGIAPGLFGETEGGGGESGYARRLGMVPTEAEVGARRRAWEAAFRRAFLVAGELERAYGGAAGEPVTEVSITWPPAIPEDSAAVSQSVCQEFREGARSLESAVRRLNPEWNDDEIAAEVQAINEREAQRRVLAVPDLGNPLGAGL